MVKGDLKSRLTQDPSQSSIHAGDNGVQQTSPFLTPVAGLYSLQSHGFDSIDRQNAF